MTGTSSYATPSQGGPSPTTPNARVKVATPASDRFAQPYVNALEDFLAAYVRADRAGDQTYPDLARHAQGAALDWAKRQVGDHIRLGVVHQGYFGGRSIVFARLDSSTYTVRECLNWATWPVVNRATGAVFQRFPAWFQSAQARIEQHADEWKVVTFAMQAGPC